jgi:hypothetical protein
LFASALLIAAESAFAAVTFDDQLFWGTYRPQPYVGLRSRSADSPLVGLMWYKPSLEGQGMRQIRHTCTYYDQLTKYGWQEHDGQSFGYQTIDDPQNGAELQVEWIKPEFSTDPDHWILRVTASIFPTTGQDDWTATSQNDLSLMWYVSSPDDVQATFDPTTGSVHGVHASHDNKEFWMSIQDASTNVSAVYTDELNNNYTYGSTYYSALMVDEHD